MMNVNVVQGWKDTGTLNVNTAVAGTITPGPTVDMVIVRDGTLSATVTVLAETSTITLAAIWEAYDENRAAWVQLVKSNNAAVIAIGTGTAGADAAITRNLPAPRSAYGFRQVRCSILNGAATGAAADTYRVSYNFQKP